MGIFKAIANGIGATLRKPRLLIILYVANALFAVIVAFPFLAIIQKELGHSFSGRTSGPRTSCGSERPRSNTGTA